MAPTSTLKLVLVFSLTHLISTTFGFIDLKPGMKEWGKYDVLCGYFANLTRTIDDFENYDEWGNNNDQYAENDPEVVEFNIYHYRMSHRRFQAPWKDRLVGWVTVRLKVSALWFRTA